MKVLLSAGHGSNTPGKRSPRGMLSQGVALYEYEFNRDIVCRLVPMLSESGIPFKVLVPEAQDIPLPERVARANAIYAEDPDCFLVSIHANAGGGTGWEVFTYYGESESDRIAEIFARTAEKAFPNQRMRWDKSDGDLDKEAPFYILKHTRCPAILTENFFMDHEKDLAFIMSDVGRELIAQMHHDAIVEYFNQKLNESS